mgnify:CR=1 FL=1
MNTFFIQLNATKEWLSLDHAEREAFVATVLHPIFTKYKDVEIKFYDAEAFSSRCSDVAVMQTENVQAYAKLMDDLRDSPFYTKPYFELVDIIPASLTNYI